jgi:hypothetical protein
MDPEVRIEDSSGSRWYMIVGVIGAIYGFAGLLFHSCAIFNAAFPAAISGMFGQKTVPMPSAIRFTNLAQSLILFGAGLMLAIGSIMLARRQPRGAALMKGWVVIRLIMLVVGLVLGFVFLQATVDFQMANMEAQREGAPANAPGMPSREMMETIFRYFLGGFTVLAAAFPLFVGILLSSRKKKDEIESWKSLIH